jgi:hypothetical protein
LVRAVPAQHSALRLHQDDSETHSPALNAARSTSIAALRAADIIGGAAGNPFGGLGRERVQCRFVVEISVRHRFHVRLILG